MCGILAILGQNTLDQKTLEKLAQLIDQRGPDYNSPIHDTNTKCGLHLRLKASVLHLRGKELTKQPLFANNNILLFNGQIYKYSNYQPTGPDSDTSFLFSKLNDLKTKEEICRQLCEIDGPYAFIYWCENLNTLFYGRDVFGRRSLCQLLEESGSPLIISSVGIQDDCLSRGRTWAEVDCSGIHCLEFGSGEVQRSKFLWDIDRIYPPTQKCSKPLSRCDIPFYPIPIPLLKPLNNHLMHHIEQPTSAIITASIGFERVLLSAVKKRAMFNQDACLECRQLKKPIQLCDHSRIALAFSGGIDSTLLALMLDRAIEPSQTIDLINVAFKDNSPDRIAAGQAFKEICDLRPGRNWRLVLSDVSISSLKSKRQNVIRHLILPCNTVIDDSLGCALWFVSQGKGRALDSKQEPLRDKLNFEKVLEQFLRYEIDCSQEINHGNSIYYDYKSPASQLFLGMGIDEQLGGYRSHQFAWREEGEIGVLREISFQMRRISSRNLGRDDRTCSHHGRDIKTPFLDFDLISYLNELPIESKLNLHPGSELGNKQILRYVGVSLGLKGTSSREKRAMQFGTRIANLEDSSEKGGDICSRLL